MSENIANIAVLCSMWEVQTWLVHHSTLQMFTSKVLSGPTDLRIVTGQLPGETAEACWRFVTLLERIRDEQLG